MGVLFFFFENMGVLFFVFFLSFREVTDPATRRKNLTFHLQSSDMKPGQLFNNY